MARACVSLPELRSFKRKIIPENAAAASAAAQRRMSWNIFPRNAGSSSGVALAAGAAAAAMAALPAPPLEDPTFPPAALELLLSELDADGRKQMQSYFGGCGDFSEKVLGLIAHHQAAAAEFHSSWRHCEDELRAVEKQLQEVQKSTQERTLRMAISRKQLLTGQSEVAGRLAEKEAELKSAGEIIAELRGVVGDKDDEIASIKERVAFDAAVDAELFDLRRLTAEQGRSMEEKDREIGLLEDKLACKDYEIGTKNELIAQDRLLIARRAEEIALKDSQIRFLKRESGLLAKVRDEAEQWRTLAAERQREELWRREEVADKDRKILRLNEMLDQAEAENKRLRAEFGLVVERPRPKRRRLKAERSSVSGGG